MSVDEILTASDILARVTKAKQISSEILTQVTKFKPMILHFGHSELGDIYILW